MLELKRQFFGALLVILTMALVIAAAVNFQQQKKFRIPEDGVTWVERLEKPILPSAAPRPAVVAYHVQPASPADKAGIREGDVLRRIHSARIDTATEVARVLVGIGAWTKADYFVERIDPRAGRGNLPVEIKLVVVVGEYSPSTILYYQYLVGAAYLFVGLFVYFRRGAAEKAIHFFLLCLASFVLFTFHYTGKLNNFDKAIYFGNFMAGLIVPTLFLHFALTFPETPPWLKKFWRGAMLYLPAIAFATLFLLITSGTIQSSYPLVEMRWLLDRLWLPFISAGYIAGAIVLAISRTVADDVIVRNQLKWLRNGIMIGSLPFTIGYVIPYSFGVVPNGYMEMTVLFLLFIPLTWAYAIIRYRLMDVDVIFQQGYVHTIATLAVLGVFYGLIVTLGKLDDLSPASVVTSILIATFIFQPIRNWIQEVLDRYVFYKDRYDYRRTLIEFARELSTETDMNGVLNSVSDRLIRTLSIRHLAFFLEDEKATSFRLYLTAGWQRPVPDIMDLSYLQLPEDGQYLFFERTRSALDARMASYPTAVRHTIADLDLTYYVPCNARGRTIAWMGVSRTEKGDFLSSDDVELLVTLAGYVGIAIENARLYRSLQRKADEYERLKEFSENIVESINVGILAADLDDTVESWNNQIERLTGIPREAAIGRRLRELLPDTFMEHYDRIRHQSGVHNIYKFELPASPVSAASTLNIAVAPLISKDGDRIGQLIIFDDVTERAELESRLVQADKLTSIGLLAAGVAHEVNTPLAVISTYAQMLAKQVQGDESKSKLLEKIAKQTFRASEIVNSLLNFSRTSTTEFVDLNLNKVLSETISLVTPQLASSNVKVLQSFDSNLGMVKGNSGKLQQVFLNLVLNARDAMEGGGVLELSTFSENNVVRVQISDTGQGIPSELLNRIYDPFFTTKPPKKGTGLGLAVTYGIVKEHGGTIDVQSRQGEGTRFQLEFPLARNAVNA